MQWNEIVRLMALLEGYRPSSVPISDSSEMVRHSGLILACEDAVQFTRVLADESVDLVFTDEPYGIQPTALSWSKSKGGFHEHANVKWDDGWPAHLTIPWVAEAARVLKPGGMLINSGFPEWGTTFKEVVRMAGLTFKGTLAWLKPGGPQMRKVNYKSAFEVFWWASKGPVSDSFSFQEQMEMRNWVMETVCPNCRVSHPVIPSKQYARAKWMEDIEWPEFLHGSNAERKRANKTQKPVWLARKFLEVHSRKGDLVLDLFCGSGTYLATALEMGRRVAGCDIREDQVAFAVDRLKNITPSFI